MTIDFRALCEELANELDNIWQCLMDNRRLTHPLANEARAVLARWGQPAATPIPVAEQWPEFSECDPQERVWAWNPLLEHWKLSRIKPSVHTHWLPANALPLPSND